MIKITKKHYILTSVTILLILLIGGYYWKYVRLNASDCTKYEKYDAWNGSCYFDCTDQKDCDTKQAQVDSELNKFFDGSKTKISTKNPKPKPTTQPASTTPITNPTDQPFKQLTLEDTESETGGKVYTVTSDQNLSPTPTDQDAEAWKLFSIVASRENIKNYVASFEVFNDSNNDSAASVWQSKQNPNLWNVNVNSAFMNDRKDLIHTMVHEFGHILTLNNTQVDYTQGSCPNFKVPEGCTKTTSILNQFEQNYWAKYGNNIPPDEGQNQDDVADFYAGKESSFVSDYAATNSVEDLAETWATFVLNAKPSGTEEKDQKVNKLYEYPILVNERSRIRSSLASEIK